MHMVSNIAVLDLAHRLHALRPPALKWHRKILTHRAKLSNISNVSIFLNILQTHSYTLFCMNTYLL